MAALAAPLVGIAGSLLGGLFGGKPATTNVSSNTASSSTGSGASTSAPVLDPGQIALKNAILGSGTQQLTSAPADLSGIQSQMLQNTNTGYNSADQVLRQTLAARGLSYSPLAGAAESSLGTQRIGAGINVLNQMPLLREQLYQQRLQNALNAFRGIPFATRGTTNFNQGGNQYMTGVSTQTNPGGMLGGLFGNLGSTAPMFGDLFGGGGQVSLPPGYNPNSGVPSSVLAGLFGGG